MTPTPGSAVAISAAVPSTSSPSSFFSSLLSPSLLSLSPLQSIVTYLRDVDRMKFCRANHDHQTILPRMRMLEPHTLTEKDWILIQQRNGPLVTSIQLNYLTELNQIPSIMRGQIKSVRFNNYYCSKEEEKEEEGCKSISREMIPPLLEELVTRGWQQYNTFRYDGSQNLLDGTELPILPATLKTLILAFNMKEEGERKSSAADMMKRILSEAKQLTHLGLSVFEDADKLISIFPSTVETLSLYMCTSEIPDDAQIWPSSLKHLILESNSENQIELLPFELPKSLASMTFASFYSNYDHTLRKASKMDSLQTINLGSGIRWVNNNIFANAFLPPNLTQLTLSASLGWDMCEEARIDCLPNTIEVLKFALNDLPFTRWPRALRVLHIYGDRFAQDLSGLPDSVEELVLSPSYTRSVGRWPKCLMKLGLGGQFFSLPSVENLPASLLELTVALPLVRRMMTSGTLAKILPRLVRLLLIGEPNSLFPFDLRLMPSHLTDLRFDRDLALMVGTNERPQIVATSSHLTRDLTESDLDANLVLMNDSKMTKYDDLNDPDEQLPFFPKPTSIFRKSESPKSDAEITSDQLFYNNSQPVISNESDLSAYELTYKQGQNFNFGAFANVKTATPVEVIERLKSATADVPINGVSFNGVHTPPLIRALTDALNRSAIIGPLALIDCQSSFAAQSQTQRTSGWRDGALFSEETLRHDMTGLKPVEEDPNKVNTDMIDLVNAIGHSKGITRIKVDKENQLFDLSHNSSSATSSSSSTMIADGFVALCRTLTQLPQLRTIVFRSCRTFSADMVQLFTRTLLSPECASIESLDISNSGVWKEHQAALAHLIVNTKTLKHLALANIKLTLSSIWQLAQAATVNQSLVTLNLSGNVSGVAGLHALRWSLRQNHRIVITVCHHDFGESGLMLLKKRRHARLKESNRVFISNSDIELL